MTVENVRPPTMARAIGKYVPQHFAERVSLHIFGKYPVKIPGNFLVARSRRGRHRDFTVDYLVALTVVGQPRALEQRLHAARLVGEPQRAEPPVGGTRFGGVEDEVGHGYRFLIRASAKRLVETSFAPSIWRAKS
jgi:hypothetical protein